MGRDSIPSPPSARPSLARRWSTQPSASSPPRASTPPRSTPSRRGRLHEGRRLLELRVEGGPLLRGLRAQARSPRGRVPRDPRAAPPSPGTPSRRSARTAPMRSERDDGWLAVFFEFWAHVLRHEELRERFALLHARVIEPLEMRMVRHAEEAGEALPEDPRKLATAATRCSSASTGAAHAAERGGPGPGRAHGLALDRRRIGGGRRGGRLERGREELALERWRLRRSATGRARFRAFDQPRRRARPFGVNGSRPGESS